MKIHFEIIRPTIALCAIVFFSQIMGAQQTILGTTDINAYIKEAPGLPATTKEAAKRVYGANPLQSDNVSMDNFYQPFEDKVNLRIEDYQNFAKQKMSATPSVEEYQAQAAKDVNRNPIIANMGGYEKVSQMSEEEARVAALHATSQFVADPFAANGIQSAGMTALYQKVISDPAYAKKFEKMSDAEKEVELRKYMANDQPVALSPDQMKERKHEMSEQQSQADRIRNAQEITLKLVEFQQKLGEVSMAFGQKLQEIEQEGHSHEVIGQEISVRYKAIPIVELGEYGRDHDPEQVKQLRIQEAKLHRERAQHELVQDAAALAEAADNYQLLVSEYLDYLNENKDKVYGGVSAADMLQNLNTEIPLVSFEAGLVGIALELSKQSRILTKKAAQWEAEYAEVMHNYQVE